MNYAEKITDAFLDGTIKVSSITTDEYDAAQLVAAKKIGREAVLACFEFHSDEGLETTAMDCGLLDDTRIDINEHEYEASRRRASYIR